MVHLTTSLPHNITSRQAAVALAIYNLMLRILFLYPKLIKTKVNKPWFLEKKREMQVRIRGFPYRVEFKSLKISSICDSEYKVAPAWSKYTTSTNQIKNQKRDVLVFFFFKIKNP